MNIIKFEDCFSIEKYGFSGMVQKIVNKFSQQGILLSMNQKNFYDFFTNIKQRNKKDILFYEQTRYRCIPWNVSTFLETITTFRTFFRLHTTNKGSRVMVCLPNSPHYAALFFACALEGHTIVPIDIQSTEDFIHKISQELEPSIYIGKQLTYTILNCIHTTIDAIEEYPYIEKTEVSFKEPPEALFEIVYTSGSTSEPKGVMLSQENIISNVNSVITIKNISKNSLFLSVLPLSHMFEQTAGLFVPLSLGAPIYYPYLKDPRNLIKFSIAHKITALVATPALFSLLHTESLNKHSPFHATKFKDFISGGAPLPKKVKKYWEHYGVHICEGYGMTEASPIVTFDDSTVETNGTGKVLPGQEVRISPLDNEIQIRGANITSGYFKQPEITRERFEDGWFLTGDIGYLDEKNNLHITGRKKNMLVTQAGVKIHPEDIEKEILNNKEIRDVVVTLNEEQEHVIAILLPSPGKTLNIQELQKDLNQNLNQFQKILEIHIWSHEDFPRLSNGKINRNAIIASFFKKEERDRKHQENKKIISIEELLGILTHTDHTTIHNDTLLVYDLHIDSIKRLELVSSIEKYYAVSLLESDITPTTKVSDLKNSIKTKRNEKPKTPSYWQVNTISSSIRSGFTSIVFALLGSFEKVTIHQEEKLPDNPLIFIANHTSHLDGPTLLRTLLPRKNKIVVVVAKDYFFKNVFTSFFVRLCFNAIPIDRVGSIEESITLIGSYLDRDYSVIIFPEGTRSVDGILQPFKQGIGFIAKEMKTKIVPVRIDGTYALLPKGKVVPKKGVVHIHIGNAVNVSQKDSYETIAYRLRQNIEEL